MKSSQRSRAEAAQLQLFPGAMKVRGRHVELLHPRIGPLRACAKLFPARMMLLESCVQLFRAREAFRAWMGDDLVAAEQEKTGSVDETHAASGATLRADPNGD